MTIGKICPKCKSVFSPSTKSCPKCRRRTAYKVRIRTDRGYLTKQTSELAEAERFQTQVQAATVSLDGPAGPTLGALWVHFLNHIGDRNRSWKDDLYRWKKHLAPQLADRLAADLRPRDVLLALPAELKPATRHRILELLSRLYNWSIRMGHFSGENPCRRVDRPRYDNIRQRYLTDAEQARLLSAIEAEPNRRTALVIKFLWATGRRRGETLKLEWSDVELESGNVLFRHTKNGRSQRVPVNQAAREVLKTAYEIRISNLVFPCGSGRHFYSFNRGWLRVRARANLTNFHLHDLRANAASRWASSGNADIVSVSKLLGHSSIDITVKRYAVLFDRRLREVAETLK